MPTTMPSPSWYAPERAARLAMKLICVAVMVVIGFSLVGGGLAFCFPSVTPSYRSA